MEKLKKFKKRKERYLPTPFSGHLPDIRRFQKNLRRPLLLGGAVKARSHFSCPEEKRKRL
jgi:hypothetical protein